MKSFREIQCTTQGLRESKASEWLVRSVFGGLVSLVAGAIGQKYGPAVGGLFLGFPSILPATITLVKKHDGRAEAAESTRGAAIGSLGLIAFAAVAYWALDAWSPTAALGAALAAWFAVSFAAWKIFG